MPPLLFGFSAPERGMYNLRTNRVVLTRRILEVVREENGWGGVCLVVTFVCK